MDTIHPNLAAPLHRALTALLGAGRAVLARVQSALTPAPEPRIARTLEWIAALAAALAGDPFWTRQPTYAFPPFPGRFAPLTAQLREECGLPPNPACTPAARAAARRRYMKKVFATVPTATIARRLARRLGLTEIDPAWPNDLLAIPHPPATWAKSHRRHCEPPLGGAAIQGHPLRPSSSDPATPRNPWDHPPDLPFRPPMS